MIEIKYKYNEGHKHYFDKVVCKYTRKNLVIKELKRNIENIKILSIKRIGVDF